MDYCPRLIVHRPQARNVRPLRRDEFTCRATRRGELILDDGRKVQASFGRPWTPFQGPTRQKVTANIDGRDFTGIMINAESFRMLVASNNRKASNATH